MKYLPMPNLYAKQITPSELAACRRVADYLRRTALPYLADPFADKTAETEGKREGRAFVEFYLTFYPSVVAPFERKLTTGIENFASGALSAEDLKNITDEFIEAHTVVWSNGVPFWKAEKMKNAD